MAVIVVVLARPVIVRDDREAEKDEEEEEIEEKVDEEAIEERAHARHGEMWSRRAEGRRTAIGNQRVSPKQQYDMQLDRHILHLVLMPWRTVCHGECVLHVLL